MSKGFKAPWWLRGAHRQTVWSTLTRRYPALETRRERLELSDGDFLDLAWAGGERGPIVLVLHGLEGSIESPYARGLLQEVVKRGWRGVLMHFRGCSGTPNRKKRAYHSGETGDLAQVMEHLQEQTPDSPVVAVGYSLGGNVLLKWLGETGQDNVLRCAVGVSVPYDLEACSRRMSEGWSRVYQEHLLRALKVSYARKRPLEEVKQLRTIRAWDEKVTAPLHGFASAEDYYSRCSSRQFLKQIAVPTLLLHARDDPFMTPSVVPSHRELSESVSIEVSQRGGHVGFVEGHPWKPTFWLETRIPAFLEKYIEPTAEGGWPEP